MPATEQTWRSLKAMHVVFAVSSVAMLVTTLWMLVADHNRPWKQHQRTFRDIETWSAQSRIDEQATDDYLSERRKLQGKWEQARREPVNLSGAQQFVDEARESEEDRDAAALIQDDINALATDNLADADRFARQEDMLERMRDLIARVKFHENLLTADVKSARAELDKAKAQYDMAVGKGRPQEELAELQSDVDQVKAQLDGSAGGPGEGAGLVSRQQEMKLHREELERIYAELSTDQAAAKKELDDHTAKLEQLHKALEEQRPKVGKTVLEMPVLDAFGSPMKIDQIWLPQLTLNNNFRDVARFDRCATCHQAIDKTKAGSATLPAYPQEHRITLQLQSPTESEAEAMLADVRAEHERGAREREEVGLEQKTEHQKHNDQLAKLYGFRLAEEGLINQDDATVSVVLPESRAAMAGLTTADVIEFVGDAKIHDLEGARRYLIDRSDWTPLTLTIRRGLPHPYSSHPRLDLFVGSLSPHPMGKFGCTICHQGQGSATTFQWASHMPDNTDEGNRWAREHGWFNNHHWIFPMLSERFLESSCLKCHHSVTELAASERFLEAPAPKLTKGHQLIVDYGCFGCHEINGFDGPTRRVGPDLRNEPNFFAAAAQLQQNQALWPAEGRGGAAPERPDALPQLAEMKSLAEQVVQNQDDKATRRQLQGMLAALMKSERYKQDVEFYESKARELEQAGGANGGGNEQAAAYWALSRELRNELPRIEALLRDVEAAGDLRRVGPSLRHVAAKNSFEFLYDWIADPHNFRPTTKMPRFFGLHDHLDGGGLAAAKEFEPIEIRAISEYLLTASQQFEYLEPAQDVEEASAERGKKVFEQRGCLACHSHADYPQGKGAHGPDLSNMGAKLALGDKDGQGAKWLYSWVREPNRYHARTVMPDTFLTPIEGADGKATDPAADVVAYLLDSRHGEWNPAAADRTMSEAETAALVDLALSHLEDKYPSSRARQYLESGIPAAQAGQLKGDEIALVGLNSENRIEKIVNYVGRRSISKYGCFACHDIPGFEDAKPIGTGLADWGRKDPSRLAFENIMQYLHNGHGQHSGAAHSGHQHGTSGSSSGAQQNGEQAAASIAALDNPFATPDEPPTAGEVAADREFFIEKIVSHEREGFIWQKLHDPRSYDFKKTENKKYHERLRMPKFSFALDEAGNEEAIEAIMTFVLGLVAEPPAAQYIYNAPPRERAIAEGQKLLEKFNCGGCHVLQHDRWQIGYEPGWAEEFTPNKFSGAAPEFDDFAFLRPHFTPEQVAASLAVDRGNRRHGTLIGAPLRKREDGTLARFESDETPIESDDTTTPVGYYEFTLFEPALINGEAWPSGLINLRVQPSMLEKKQPGFDALSVFPARGGDLARLLFPLVIQDNPTYNSEAKAPEAWGWLPPPLPGEGRKVQTDWLHAFLLDPYLIRPAAVLRMPKFNMSSDEAQTLANYFAAVERAEYPYDFDQRTRTSYLASAAEQHPARLDDAFKIVANKCNQCHLISDFSPGGDPKALAPQLNRVHARLRPDFVKPWVANPKRIVPYTGMPVNIPHNMPLPAEMFPGTSEQQLNGVVDLIMNFDHFIKEQYSIKDRIPKPMPADAASGQPAAGQGSAGQN